MAWHAVKQRKSTQKKNQEQITLTLTAQRFGLERAGTNARPLDGGALNLVGTRTPANGRAAAPSSAPATSRCNSCAPCGRAQRTEKITEKKKKEEGRGSGRCWPPPAAAQEPLATMASAAVPFFLAVTERERGKQK